MIPLHQILVGATVGDAITDHALTIQRWLRHTGIPSEIYAAHIHPAIADRIRPLASYRPGRPQRAVIFHHSVGDPAVARVAALPVELILVYHNITPSAFFVGVDPAWAERARQGREQLALLRPRARLAVAVSDYNATELLEAGFASVRVVPLPLDPGRFALAPDPALSARFAAGAGPWLLFVGRLAPNKRQEDLVRLLAYLRRLRPDARLALVGDPWEVGYDRFLQRAAGDLGLADALLLTGKVRQAELIACYHGADLFVSMSEHEGFGMPLIESMHLGLPVLAYAAGAVPATVGGAGVVFRHKHYPALAELIDLLLADDAWRARLIVRGHERARVFLSDEVRRAWFEAMGSAGLAI